MSRRPDDDTYQEGMELISRLLDGGISDADFARLHTLLEGDADLRKIYLQSVDQEIEMSCRGAGVPNREIGFPSSGKRFSTGARIAVAAALIFTLLAIFLIRDSRKPVRSEGAPPSPVVVEHSGTEEVPAVPPDPRANQPPDPASRFVPAAPDTWVVDFEDGLPIGWSAEFVTADLPAGSAGAARCVTNESRGERFRQILPPMAWETGHFAIRENSHLYLTMKIEKAATFSVFMLTHVPDLERAERSIYEHIVFVSEERAGTWRKLTIPLAEFDRKDGATGEFVEGVGPAAGEVAWQIFFSSLNPELDLILDEIRVSAEGPGQ